MSGTVTGALAGLTDAEPAAPPPSPKPRTPLCRLTRRRWRQRGPVGHRPETPTSARSTASERRPSAQRVSPADPAAVARRRARYGRAWPRPRHRRGGGGGASSSPTPTPTPSRARRHDLGGAHCPPGARVAAAAAAAPRRVRTAAAAAPPLRRPHATAAAARRRRRRRAASRHRPACLTAVSRVQHAALRHLTRSTRLGGHGGPVEPGGRRVPHQVERLREVPEGRIGRSCTCSLAWW